MSTAVIIDLAAVGVILVCTLLGAARGLIRTVTGLAVLIVALLGATMISNTFAGPVADTVADGLAKQIVNEVSQQARDRLDSGGLSIEIPGVPDGLQQTVSGLLDNFRGILSNSVSGMGDAAEATLRASLTPVLRSIFSGIFFFVSFTLLSLALKLVANALNLAAKLPVLHTMNTAGGVIIGAAQGILWVCTAVWTLSRFGYTYETLPDSYLLRILSGWLSSSPFAV